MNKFCPLPFNHLAVIPSGDIRVCCRFADKNLLDNYNTLEEAFNSQEMHNLRTRIKDNQAIDSCSKCYLEEDAGRKSLRQYSIDEFEVEETYPKLEYVELALSNDCNLQCQNCSSEFSTKWFDLEMKLYGKSKAQAKYMSIDDIVLSNNIKKIKFTGGEPLLYPRHMHFLKRLTGKLNLTYFTNGTITPKKELLDIWRLHDVEIFVSIDGYKDLNSKLRRFSVWDKIINNIEIFKEFNLHCYTTVNINNIEHLEELDTWWSQYNRPIIYNAIRYPEELAITNLDDNKKDTITKLYKTKPQFEHIINYMKGSDERT